MAWNTGLACGLTATRSCGSRMRRKSAVITVDSEALEAESVSGNVSVDARVRDISVSSVSGDLDLSVDVQELSLETVSGDITLLHTARAAEPAAGEAQAAS